MGLPDELWVDEPFDDGSPEFSFRAFTISVNGGTERTDASRQVATTKDAEAWLLDAFRAEVDHSYQVAERLDAKTQRAIGFTGAFFALVQAAAVSSLLKSLERNDQHWLLAFAMVALVALALAGLSVLRQEKLRAMGQVPLTELTDLMIAVYASQGQSSSGEEVSRQLARIYAAVVTERRLANERRSDLYVRARLLCMFSIFWTSAELAWALIARLS